MPEPVRLADAALIEPLSCAVHGFDVLAARVGAHVLIYGSGTMGLMMLQLAKRAGAASVDVVDVNQAKLAIAAQAGLGGGARNELLCQLTADACGLPVVDGPAEAASLGNILVQLRALGAAPGDLDGMRPLVRATQPLRRFEPAGNSGPWDAAERRMG